MYKRQPALRAFAKKYGKTEEAKQFVEVLPHQYYEENNLHGLLLEQGKAYENCVNALDRFLPYVDNWATGDLLAVKIVKKHRDLFIKEAVSYTHLNADEAGNITKVVANGAVATTSMLFIIEAVGLGMFLKYTKFNKWVNTAVAIVLLVLAVALGLHFPVYLSLGVWHVIIFA